jgi:transposase
MGKKVKGRKRHLAVDTQGLIWGLEVTAASVQDRDGALRLLAQIEACGERLKTLYADGAYAGVLEDIVSYFCGWTLEIIRKLPDQKGFVLLPKRWLVERTFAWLLKWRRLRSDYEFEPKSSEAMIRWAMVARMARHLCPGST